ncbi:NAD(P)-dependent alcohol dehydrogenase [Leptospira sp. 85282-16]|uniref:NAD(P)-dependent alcohol dehydrogenase n=1 Tax=Leptospira montravelensis TaxID=2484961 RepID=A0ABY2LPH2_9LEPT|nr:MULTISPECIES: NAD(P)-dependent alcohol dehydrogenase [Leptospira]MCT8334533.1 NAD(P)-dependent alcohol dehydrogenase [Leptospira sp. 85282-16]TGK80887.1 NAD(P)-dependent alcohol dehydrogenase [Leptospira montravelensis]TGL01521.1 NAD(P)-dependent alcohol dehydrogenase [Leptospira montravelensis]
MKQAQIQSFGLDHLKIVEVSEPAKPNPTEVLVRIRAASLNYRDSLVVEGKYNPKFPLPLVPCSDGAGEVVAIGSEVSEWKVGDRVLLTFAPKWISKEATHAEMRNTIGGPLPGTLREFALVPETGLVRIPTHLSYEEASTLPCAALTAWSGLFQFSQLKPGEFVVVQGTGGVSIFALQFAKLVSAKVILTSSSSEKLERGKELGADYLINYKETPDWGKEVRRITEKVGADHIIEVGGAGTLEQSIAACRPFGVIHLIGILAGKSGELNLLPAVMNNLKIQGLVVGGRKAFIEMNQAIEASGLCPIVDKVFSLEESTDAIRYLRSGSHFGKIVIRI